MNYNSWLSGFIFLITALLTSTAFFVVWNKFFYKKEKAVKQRKPISKFSYFIIAFLLFVLFYFDFLREYIFQNLEQRMRYFTRVSTSSTPAEIKDYTDGNLLDLLGQISANQAYSYKYLFFGLFTLAYFTVSSITLQICYPKINTTKFTSFLYGIGISTVLIIFSLFFFPWEPQVKNGFYLVSMEIGHFFQSSLPTLLLLVSFKIYGSYPIESDR